MGSLWRLAELRLPIAASRLPLHMIKYLGSKRLLVPRILAAVGDAGAPGTALDLFSGTSRVGHALKRAGWRVIANDHNAYAGTLARCYVQADAEKWKKDAAKLVAEFNRLPGKPGYFTEMFCERARYVQAKNGERIDAIREAIAKKSLHAELEAVLLVSLMEAADRVDSTTGVQMAYLKRWAARSHNALELRVPELLPRAQAGKGVAWEMDAVAAARRAAKRYGEVDVAYLDPPYNQHSYLGNYHVWETLVRWDKPAAYGVANKRVDVRERRSGFNSKRGCARALREVIGAVKARRLVVSFSDEGYVSRGQVEEMLREWAGVGAGGGAVRTMAHDYKRYVGAQIGIYNPRGEKVGRVGRLRNTEYLFVVDRAGVR